MKKINFIFLLLFASLVGTGVDVVVEANEHDPLGVEITALQMKVKGYLHSGAVPNRYLYQDDLGVGLLPMIDTKAENYRMTGIYKGDVLRGSEGGRYGSPNLY